MDSSQQPPSGFPSHVQDQLNQAALSVSQSSRPRGQFRRGRPRYHQPNHPQYYQQSHPGHFYHNAGVQFGNPPTQQTWNNSIPANPIDRDSFPPLGATRHNVSTNTHQVQNVPPQQHSNQPGSAQPPANASYVNQQHNSQPLQQSRRDYPTRARGGHYRGGNQAHRVNYQHQQQGAWDQSSATNSNDYRRPPPSQNRLHTPSGQPYFGDPEEQRAYQRKVMDQSDFLNHLANQSLKSTQLTTEEQQMKESFRKELEVIAQKVVADTKGLNFDPQTVRLKTYGSLGNGFGVAGCDMDLLLTFPQDVGPLGEIEIDSRRKLEKALLDAGIGARLLTNTRVPILKVCQLPSTELLKNLRENRASWEKSLLEPESVSHHDDLELLCALTIDQIHGVEYNFPTLDFQLEAAEIPLPASPPPEHARLEYTGDCGIQCDINFSNYVALHNTRLLRTYGLSDPRVRQMGVFVKAWAKVRDINTPYYGTLSSYGYVLMVLHYLMNVANPPVIPNLQDCAKNGWDGPTDRDLVEGFDVRFIRDMNEVKKIMEGMPRNRESVGSLLRGFFHYFANPRGFHWNYDVISIRSRGGRINKHSKGWTEAKWSNEKQSVRLRFLLAIEDPFELEHNVGRTVGHNGLVAIRDEFRRAWTTIDNIQFDKEAKFWLWTNDQGQKVNGDDFMARVERRGDLLRKDQDFSRQKLRQIRQELEAKEKALQSANMEKAENGKETDQTGTFNTKADNTAHESLPLSSSAEMALTHGDAFQIREDGRPVTNSQAEDENSWQADSVVTTLVAADIDWDVSFTTAELGLKEDTQAKDNVVGAEPFGTSKVDEAPGPRYEADPTEQAEETATPADTGWMDGDTRSSMASEPLPRIPWDRTTFFGRKLLQRDKKICEGKWSESVKRRLGFDRKLAKLDQMFPYNPDMSIAELAHKNEMLRTKLWQKTDMKVKEIRQPGESPRNQVARPQGAMSIPSISVNLNKDMSAQYSQPSQPSMDLTHDPQVRPSAIEPSSRRQHRMKSKPQYRTGDSFEHEAAHNIVSQREVAPNTKVSSQSGETSDNNIAWETKKSTIYKSPSDHGLRMGQEKFQQSRSGPGRRTNTDPSQPHPRSIVQPEQRRPTIYAGLVPSTLLPTGSPAQRPQEENPNAMSISHQPNLIFDPRQLADLEIIRRGGNGCARAGEEFNIERDYEWGGGGELAGRSTSSGIEQVRGA